MGTAASFVHEKTPAALAAGVESHPFTSHSTTQKSLTHKRKAKGKGIGGAVVHACCFHTGSASLCVDGRNDSTIFSPCQPFSRKKLVRTCGRRERPHALCAIFSWSPLARCCCARAAAVRAAARAVRIMGLVAARLRAGPIPTLRSLWHGPPLRRTQAARALRAPAGSKKRGMPHPAAYFAGPCARNSRRAVRRARPLPPR